MFGESVSAPPAWGNFRLHFRVMAYIQSGVIQEISKKMAQGDTHTLDYFQKIQLFQKCPTLSFNDSYFNAHDGFLQPNETMIALVTKIFNRASGNNFSQPIFWS
jgi:hypothetical protein